MYNQEILGKKNARMRKQLPYLTKIKMNYVFFTTKSSIIFNTHIHHLSQTVKCKQCGRMLK